MPRPSILRVATGAGSGALAGSRFGPTGAVVGGIIGGVVSIFGSLSRDSSDALRLGRTTFRGAEGPEVWRIGTSRGGGHVANAAASEIKRGADVYTGGNTVAAGRPGSVLRVAVALSRGELATLDKVFMDDLEVPLHTDDYPLAAHGKVRWVDQAQITATLAVLEARLQALVSQVAPGGSTTPLGRDLSNEIEMLRAQQAEFRLSHRIGTDRTSVLNIFTDLGGVGVSAADQRVTDIFGGRWNETLEKLDGLSWVLVELYSFTDGPNFQNRQPTFEFLTTGMLGPNPAEVIHWVLTERMNVAPADIEGLAQATARCNEMVAFNAFTRGTEDAGNPFTLSELLSALFIPAGASNAFVDAVLAAWNRRYAGASTGEMRYQAHGVITSDMLERPENLLRELGEAMGGWVAVTGNSYKLIAGEATATVATITDADIALVFPVWRTAPSTQQRVRALSGRLVQDKEADWTAADLAVVQDTTLLATAGYREKDVGPIPFQTSDLVARRLQRLQLRRSAPSLLQGELTLGPGAAWANFSLDAGDRVRLNLEAEGVNAIFVIESVVKSINTQTVDLIVREDPDTVYGLPPEIPAGGKFPLTIAPVDPPSEVVPGALSVTKNDLGGAPSITIVYAAGTPAVRLEVPLPPAPVPADYGTATGGPYGAPTVPSAAAATVGVKTWLGLDAAGGAVTYAPGDELDGSTMAAPIAEAALGPAEVRGEYRVYRIGATRDDMDMEQADPTVNVFEWADVLYGISVSVGVDYDSAAPQAVTLLGVLNVRVLQIVRIRATPGAVLVYRTGSAAWAAVDAALDGVQVNADGGFNVQIVAPAVAQRTSTVTFAARAGAGTAGDPYVYHGALPFGVGPDSRPIDFNKVETRQPTMTDPGVQGQTWTVVA